MYIYKSIHVYIQRSNSFFNFLQHDRTDQETESDQESVQNSSFGRISLARSVLQVWDEHSLFNKKVYEYIKSQCDITDY